MKDVLYKWLPYKDIIQIIGYSVTDNRGITRSSYGGNFTIEEGIYHSSVKQLVVNGAEALDFGGGNLSYFIIRNDNIEEWDDRTVEKILVFVENLCSVKDIYKPYQIITKVIEYFPDGTRIEMSFGIHKDHILGLLISPSDNVSIIGCEDYKYKYSTMKLVNLLNEEEKKDEARKNS